MTKAALNMLVRPYHLLSSMCVAVFLIAYITSSRQAYKQKLERPDFTVITLCPGWVKTGVWSTTSIVNVLDSACSYIF